MCLLFSSTDVSTSIGETLVGWGVESGGVSIVLPLLSFCVVDGFAFTPGEVFGEGE